MRPWVSLPALVLALSALGVLPASSVQAAARVPADTTASLPITSFGRIVADTAHGHLFLSSSSQNEILVTDLTGQPVATITGQDGVQGMALSQDGSTLYAALASSQAVTAIDTATLKQTASYPLGAYTPQDVAVQSGKVWVSYNGAGGGNSGVGDIDLSAVTPAFQTQSAMGGWYMAPELAADPHDTGVLIAAEPAMSPSTVASYNVSADPATATVKPTWFQNCTNEEDLAVAPGGSEFTLACGSPYAHYRYSTTDLSQQGAYTSTNYPDAIAFDSNGDAAAGTGNNPSSPDVYVYRPGDDNPLNTYNLASTGNLAARGLAWSADGSHLFAVLQGGTSSSYSLEIIDHPAVAWSHLSLSGPSTASITKAVTLTGALEVGGAAYPPAGTPITVTRSVSGGTDKTFSLSTNASGVFTLTDTPPAVGQYTYTASYSGDASTAPATASQAVNVTLIPTALTLSTGSAAYTYQPTMTVTAHLGTTHSNRTVSIYAQPAGGSKTLLKTGTVNASGNLAVSYTAPHNTTFSAVFSGDQDYAPVTVTRNVSVLAKVSESISGYYGKTTIGGTTYRLYHHTALLKASATVAPGKPGECVQFEVEEYYQSAWHPNVATGCNSLSSSSKASTTFGLTTADLGYHYRVRADYPGDVTNAGNSSAWQYLIVKK